MDERILETDRDIEEGCAWLAEREPRFEYALKLCGRPPLRRRPGGFKALLGAIVSQQISVAAAATVLARLEAAGLDEAAAIERAEPERLRACGLSRQKVRYLKALAAAQLDYGALERAPTEEVIAKLCAITGIGRWTAEIYAMFSLRRADVFAPADLGLQEGARRLFAWPERPRPAALGRIAEAWSPWRAVAARLLWAYYHVDDPAWIAP